MNKVIAFIWGWCLLIVCIMGSIHTMALNPSFYTTRYQKMDLASDLGVSDQDLNASITMLLEYIKGDTDTLDQTITIHGKTQETFNEREKSHMIDVRSLYQNAMHAGIVSFILLLGILFYFLLRYQKKTIAFLTRGFLQAGACLILAFLFFGLWIATDFTSFWTWFHTVFFSNNLWLLNPATDFMINMLPETIFYQLVLSCVFMVCVLLVPCLIVSVYIQRKKVPIGFDYEDTFGQSVSSPEGNSGGNGSDL